MVPGLWQELPEPRWQTVEAGLVAAQDSTDGVLRQPCEFGQLLGREVVVDQVEAIRSAWVSDPDSSCGTASSRS
jgi:hypothetical protein